MAAKGSRGGRASNTAGGVRHSTPTSSGRGAPAAAQSGRRGRISDGTKTRETLPRVKANINPAQIIKDNTQQRRTSEQVRQDNERAAAAAIATKDANEKAERDRIQRLADAEDDLRKEDVEYRKHAMRPDLLPSKGKGTVPIQLPIIDESPGDIEAEYEDAVNIPEDSVLDSESSDGGVVFYNEAEENGSDDAMGDVTEEQKTAEKTASSQVTIGESLDAVSTAVIVPAKPAKKKPARGILRAAVRSVHSETTVAGMPAGGKRKAPESTDQTIPSEEAAQKHPKNVDDGLIPSWRKYVPRKTQQPKTTSESTPLTSRADSRASNQHSRASSTASYATIDDDNEANTQDGKDPEPQEIFDQDEDENTLKVARAAKGNKVQAGTRGKYRRTTSMAVKVEEKPVAMTSGPIKKQRSKKEKYTNAHLPFPPSRGGACMKKWRKEFKSSIISWAGTTEDPFGTNSILDDPVTQVWKKIYPDLKDCMADPMQKAAVIGVSEILLTGWRSSIGKHALAVLEEFWNADDELQESAENRAKYVSWALDGFNFVYKAPESKSGKGAFQSELVLKTFAFHLKQAYNSKIDWDDNLGGALALCSAAMERALNLWKSGNYVSDQGDKKDKKRDFADANYGEKARTWFQMTQSFTESRWDCVIYDASVFIGEGDDDEESEGEAGGEETMDPRLQIVLD